MREGRIDPQSQKWQTISASLVEATDLALPLQSLVLHRRALQRAGLESSTLGKLSVLGQSPQ